MNRIVLLSLLFFHYADGYKICVYEGKNSCNTCDDSYTNISSISLPRSNFTVQFCSIEIHLKSLLAITTGHLVTVKGMPSQLKCDQVNTGIYISEVSGLTLKDITLVSCGNDYNDPLHKKNHHFRSGIYLFSCTSVTIERVSVISSKGSGLTMLDNNGTVKIIDCTFNDSKDTGSEKMGGSGLHIVLSYCSPRKLRSGSQDNCQVSPSISYSDYLIHGCTFSKNFAGPSVAKDIKSPEDHELLAEGFKRGGGMCIVIDQESTANVIKVKNCTFTENSALWGGGLYVAVVGNAADNIVDVEGCTISNNKCTHLSGGGMSVGFQVYDNSHQQNNTITFRKCLFEKNEALMGGGATIYSSLSNDLLPNEVVFVNCTWINNAAQTGAALDITPQVWKSFVYDKKTKIVFERCNFLSNHLSRNATTMERFQYHRKGAGTIFAVGYHIQFKGIINFNNNAASAMYLTSTEVEFCSDSKITFSNNKGFIGGGICMIGFSAIILNDDSSFLFTNNTAMAAGGAIYQSSYDIRDYFTSQSCFIRYRGSTENVQERNITFIFENNAISKSNQIAQNGRSIFTSTLIPCCKSRDNCNSSSDTFNTYIANFTFKDENSYDISTHGKEIKLVHETVFAIPGERVQLPIVTLNDLMREVLYPYLVTVVNFDDANITVDSEYTYISNKYIRFYGEPGSKADVILESAGMRKLMIKFLVEIQECPPGFFYVKEKYKCICSFDTERKFSAIQFCDNEAFEAKLDPSFWVGYDHMNESEAEFGKEKDFVFCICPFGHCLNEHLENDYETQLHILPSNTSITEIDNIICGDSRTGVLCSRCREGYAAQYHESKYECGRAEDNCKWGWLLYIVSEILPVTIFFIMVMVLNINFVDGSVNGFILYVQLTDTMLIKGNRYILFPQYSFLGLQIYRCITRIFNLNFFAIDSLSFCLWGTASTLDLLAFKYITILYASTLVIALIAVFKYCHSKRLNNIIVKMKGGETAATTKSDIIRGVSGFLVICYSECMRVSLLLLTPVYIYGTNEAGKYGAFYNGELTFFRGKHVFYALPALVIVLVVGILPPLMLISYPLCYRVLAIMKIGETKFAKLLCKCIPLEKFKPFFDSFQSSYKDKYRFFSGLYFLYRLVTLLTFAFRSELNAYYILVQTQFTVILMTHAVCQPYKKRWHNILDTLLFTNLSIINAITLFNFNLTHDVTASHTDVNIASSVQLVLLFLPLVYMTLYTLKKTIDEFKRKKIAKRVFSKLSGRNQPTSEPSDYYQLSNRFSLTLAEERIRDDSIIMSPS